MQSVLEASTMIDRVCWRRPLQARVHPRARGFTMIEMLVAVLVLSLGLLGYASLLAATLRANQSANHRTIATALAYDALDAMRANRNEAVFYQTRYDDVVTASVGDAVWKQQSAEWKQRVRTLLPNGEGEIVLQTGVVAVRVRWADDRSIGAVTDDRTTFILVSRL
jgi:type IV pilus assembly protein PilV